MQSRLKTVEDNEFPIIIVRLIFFIEFHWKFQNFHDIWKMRSIDFLDDQSWFPDIS